MVQIERNGITLLVPEIAYEMDYRDFGWKILNEKQEEKPAPQEKLDEKVDNPIQIEKGKNSNKKFKKED